MEFQVGGTCVHVNIADREDLLNRLGACFDTHRGFALATLNLDHLAKLHSDPAFREAYALHDFVTADGNPVVWLSRAAGQPVELITGSDLIRPVLRLAAMKDVPVGFIGSTEATLLAAVGNLVAEIPGLEVRACVAPPMGFDPASPEARILIDELAGQGVRLLLLALGAPKQERLAARGRLHQPNLGFLSVGAGLDFIAGTQRRAPPLIRRMALEWLWRLALNPRRLFLRYLNCALLLPREFLRAYSRQSLASYRARSGKTCAGAPKNDNGRLP